MTIESHKALSARELEQVWGKGNVAVVDELYAADMIDHDPVPGLPPGREGLKVFVGALHAAFGDMTFTTEVVLAEGDIVARRWTMRATHRAPFLGIPTTHRAVVMTGIDILRVTRGRISEVWHQEDVAGLMKQLGAG